jgi:exodeoxyribonuclease VII small subunit
MNPADTPIEALTYEQALSELEAIVAALEGEGNALESSIALYERGQLLVQRCASLLEKAELRVQTLEGNSPQP